MKYTWLAPEVMQTSSMDCGPACLKSMLQGMNISVNYSRLREVCKTDVDGTSIDTLEELACELGLDAQQILVPLDHLHLPEAKAMPAIIVSQLPNNMTHFIIIWRRFGPWIQIMDPSTGRRWVHWKMLKQMIYVHRASLPVNTWIEWAETDEYQTALLRRLTALGFSIDDAENILSERITLAKSHSEWHFIAGFDALISWCESLVSARALLKGKEVENFIHLQLRQSESSVDSLMDAVPGQYWWVLSDEDDKHTIQVKAAVLVRVNDKHNSAIEDKDRSDEERTLNGRNLLDPRMYKKETSPWLLLYNLLQAEQRKYLRWFVLLIFIGAATITLQALLFQGLLSMNGMLAQQGVSSFLPMIFLFIVLSALFDMPVTRSALALGRQVEMQFRITLFNKIPRIHDPYFRSRLLTDIASRSHKLYVLRLFPAYLVALLQQSSLIVFTLIGITWLDIVAGIVACVMVVFLIVAIIFLQRILSELEARAEVQSGVVNMFYYDTLKGLRVIRSHVAQATVQSEQEMQLNRWGRTQYAYQRKHMWGLLWLDLVGFFCIAGLLFGKSLSLEFFVPNFLWLYWLLRLPYLVKQLAIMLLDLPPYKVSLARYAELLGATEVQDVHSQLPINSNHRNELAGFNGGVDIHFKDVSIEVAGHSLLKNVNLHIPSGQHIAVVGESGAGKTSLCELLLGWHSPSQGQLLIDGKPLEGEVLTQLRKETAWVDTGIQIWDRSFLENVSYDHGNLHIGEAGLDKVLSNLPDGIQSPLGESGRCLSGGEGQRIRIARAFGVVNPRLVILDEPCRGLDRDAREHLLQQLRSVHKDTTLLCITHDISEAMKFPFVILIEQGVVVEQGAPEQLLKQTGSTLKKLQEQESLLAQSLLDSGEWQPLNIANGQVSVRMVQDVNTSLARATGTEASHA